MKQDCLRAALQSTSASSLQLGICCVCEETDLESSGSRMKVSDIPNSNVLTNYGVSSSEPSNPVTTNSPVTVSFKKGDSVLYMDKDGPVTCTVVHVEVSDGDPFYTLKHPNGNERQTTQDRLSPSPVTVGSQQPQALVSDSATSAPYHPTLRLYVGDTDSDGNVLVCASCYNCLHSKKTPQPPKNSIYLTNIGGDVPDCLKDLTFPEQLMISPIICKSYVVKLVSYGSKTSAQRGIKGNTISFMQDTQTVIKNLPCLDSVTDNLKVAFIGDTSCPLPIQKIKKLLVVRREKVRNALMWLCENNLAFKENGITWDKSVVDSLPENDIPRDILDNITRSSDVDSASGESSSYVPHEETPLPDAAENLDDDDDSGDIPMSTSGVIDIDTTQVSSDNMWDSAVKNLDLGSPDDADSDDSILKVKSGSKPVNAWDNPNFWPLAFPTLFPYGTGGCNDSRPKLGIWIRHLLNLRDDRFRLHYSFMFVVYNILNVRSVCKNTRFCLKRDFSANSPLVIDSASLMKTFAEIKKSKSSNPFIKDPSTRKIMNQLKAVGKNVVGSDFHRRSLRHEIRSLMVKLGLPSFFITINPADLNHPLVLHFAGKKVNLDAPFSGPWLKKEERAVLVAKDPVAAAKFFHTLVEVWLRDILGTTGKSKRNNVGVLGRVSGYFGTVETQGRGSLHLHMMVWVHGSKNIDEMVTKLQDDASFSIRLKDYLSSVISEQFPHGDVPGNLPPEESDKHVCSCRPPDPAAPNNQLPW